VRGPSSKKQNKMDLWPPHIPTHTHTHTHTERERERESVILKISKVGVGEMAQWLRILELLELWLFFQRTQF
jgi:hypothetical protein